MQPIHLFYFLLTLWSLFIVFLFFEQQYDFNTQTSIFLSKPKICLTSIVCHKVVGTASSVCDRHILSSQHCILCHCLPTSHYFQHPNFSFFSSLPFSFCYSSYIDLLKDISVGDFPCSSHFVLTIAPHNVFLHFEVPFLLRRYALLWFFPQISKNRFLFSMSCVSDKAFILSSSLQED